MPPFCAGSGASSKNSLQWNDERLAQVSANDGVEMAGGADTWHDPQGTTPATLLERYLFSATYKKELGAVVAAEVQSGLGQSQRRKPWNDRRLEQRQPVWPSW